MQSAPEASPLCTRKSSLCCVTGGGGEVAAVRPGMPWRRGPLPLRRSPRISAAGAMPLGRLKVAVQLSAEGGKVAVCANPHGRGAGGSRAPRSREKASDSFRYAGARASRSSSSPVAMICELDEAQEGTPWRARRRAFWRAAASRTMRPAARQGGRQAAVTGPSGQSCNALRAISAAFMGPLAQAGSHREAKLGASRLRCGSALCFGIRLLGDQRVRSAPLTCLSTCGTQIRNAEMGGCAAQGLKQA